MAFKIQTPSHLWHYLLVLASTVAVLLLEVLVPKIGDGLTVTPFILVTTIAAMFGSFGSGIFAILASGAAVAYVVPPMGFGTQSDTVFKMLEFMLITSVIFVISWRSRTLYASNIVLKEMTKSLQDITSGLQTQVKGDKKRVEQLNAVNHKLVSLVDEFIKDDEYWARKITTPLAPLPKHISHNQHPHSRFGRLHR